MSATSDPRAPHGLSAETLADRLAAQTFQAATARLNGLLDRPRPAPAAPADRGERRRA